ncbi:parapinopsin-like isoform X2 [Lethenteron reissneri]|uniref:parapinopsin-like isoform X2 n=1 Tax=Lethenteron reissneri TaxID=7753 RepID=UPI002AB72D81|nr:parapinopsin-like isoform X2 [Lethenteron reissneri]
MVTMTMKMTTTMMVMMVTSTTIKPSSSHLLEASSTNETSTATPAPSLGPVGYGLLAALMGVTTAASVTLNSIVVATTVRYRALRQPLNYALLSLACADLGVALGGGVATTVTNALRSQLQMEDALCQAEGFLVAFFGLAGLNSICVLAAERFVMVCRPLSSMHFGGRHALLALGAAWLWALAWATPPLLGWGRYGPEGASRVKYSVTQRAEQRVGVMVLLMIVAFLFCWLPYAACALVVIFQPGIQLSPLAASIPLYAAKSSTAYNPIIYILLNRQITEAAKARCGESRAREEGERRGVPTVTALCHDACPVAAAHARVFAPASCDPRISLARSFAPCALLMPRLGLPPSVCVPRGCIKSFPRYSRRVRSGDARE